MESGPDQHYAAEVAVNADVADDSWWEPSCVIAEDYGDHPASGRRHFRFHYLAAAVVRRKVHHFCPGNVTPADQIRDQYHLAGQIRGQNRPGRGALYALGERADHEGDGCSVRRWRKHS